MLIFDICNETEVVVEFPHDNQEILYFQYISVDSTSHFYKQFFKFMSGKNDCYIRRNKTTEVVVGQTHKIKMNIRVTNLNHKLSLQERITEPVYLLIQSKLFMVSCKGRGKVV